MRDRLNRFSFFDLTCDLEGDTEVKVVTLVDVHQMSRRQLLLRQAAFFTRCQQYKQRCLDLDYPMIALRLQDWFYTWYYNCYSFECFIRLHNYLELLVRSPRFLFRQEHMKQCLDLCRAKYHKNE